MSLAKAPQCGAFAFLAPDNRDGFDQTERKSRGAGPCVRQRTVAVETHS